MSIDTIAQQPNIGTPSQAPISGSTNSVPNLPGLIRSGLNVIDLYRVGADYQRALDSAEQQLANAPEGSAVVIEQSFSTAGNREFRVTSYGGTNNSSVMPSADVANEYVRSPKLEPNDGVDRSTSYTIVWKGDANVSPVLSNAPATNVISTAELQGR